MAKKKVRQLVRRVKDEDSNSRDADDKKAKFFNMVKKGKKGKKKSMPAHYKKDHPFKKGAMGRV